MICKRINPHIPLCRPERTEVVGTITLSDMPTLTVVIVWPYYDPFRAWVRLLESDNEKPFFTIKEETDLLRAWAKAIR